MYISTSLWEDPGHTLIEASALNVPIITSKCPSGPFEFYDKTNVVTYNLIIPKSYQSVYLIFLI